MGHLADIILCALVILLTFEFSQLCMSVPSASQTMFSTSLPKRAPNSLFLAYRTVSRYPKLNSLSNLTIQVLVLRDSIVWSQEVSRRHENPALATSSDTAVFLLGEHSFLLPYLGSNQIWVLSLTAKKLFLLNNPSLREAAAVDSNRKDRTTLCHRSSPRKDCAKR
jgi:hypothetical protein